MWCLLCVYLFCCLPSSDSDSQVLKQQHVQGNSPRSQLRHHQSFNQPASSPGSHGQHRAQAPRRTPSHGAQLLSTHLPHIRISLDPGEPLDPGLKQEISQQVREFRAQKLSQRGRSPGPIQEHGLGPKGPSKSQKEHLSQGPVSQPIAVPIPYPVVANNQKEKPRERPLSAPSQAAIQGLMCPDQQLKALQPHPQSPGQVQRPQSGSNLVPIPAVKLVSGHCRGRSQSPCSRGDVDIERQYQGGQRKEMRPAVSHECLAVPSDWEVTAFDPTDPLSQSFPNHALHSTLCGQRSSQLPIPNHSGGHPRARSHSPRCRIDVDIEPEYQSRWKERGPAVSGENLPVPLDWQVSAFDSHDPLSQSFPDHTLHSALSRQRGSYSPASHSGSFLQVPDYSHFLGGRREGIRKENIGGSSSMCDLSASAPADVFRHNLSEVRLMSSCSSEHLPSISSTSTSPCSWLNLSPRTSPQMSPSSSGSWSAGTFSPVFSPDTFVSNTPHKFSPPFHDNLLPPKQASYPLISSDSTPHCSPYASPFGSQTQISVRSVQC